jgi:hypothetical protein
MIPNSKLAFTVCSTCSGITLLITGLSRITREVAAASLQMDSRVSVRLEAAYLSGLFRTCNTVGPAIVLDSNGSLMHEEMRQNWRPANGQQSWQQQEKLHP